MKKLVIYYSFEGNTRLIAQTIAKAVHADILELKPVQEIQTKSFMKYVWGGQQVVMKKTPNLEPLIVKPKDYDLIFMGTPVWAFTYAPIFRTFFATNKLWDKKVALFCTHEGMPGKTLPNMSKALKGNDLITATDFLNVLKNPDANQEKAEIWAHKILVDIENQHQVFRSINQKL
ncbi:flavodoxin [bacterium]|jgi:flavodoxin|nr:flavodoxin [bacterium]MBT3582129.1 flavodoxin [bacterium]MBT4552862.1 flavodoxin [bacterium]MBT5988304.1 flavodoxin [bacterium]MBT7087459.1 flavodoxin [bacterium]